MIENTTLVSEPDEAGTRLEHCQEQGFAPVIQEGVDIEVQGSPEDLASFETLSKPCYKVVTCDVKDDIIPLHSSLMVGIA